MRRFYITFVLAFLSSLVCTRALAYDFEVNGIYYNITSSEDFTVEVTRSSSSYDYYKGDIDIPSTVSYNDQIYRVTSIGERAFWNCTEMTNVTIPEGVTKIDDEAFEYAAIHSVVIPKSVSTIGT